MAAFRENAHGGFDVYAHRVKTLLLLAALLVFTGIGIAVVVVDPKSWKGWACLLFFAVVGGVLLPRWWRSGILSGKPALVLGWEELYDRWSRLRVRWDDVERIELRELYTHGGTQRFLGLWTRDPEAAFASTGRLQRKLSKLRLEGWPPVLVPISLLGTTTEELLGLVRQVYSGPIQGFESPPDPTPVRPSRLSRFARWALEWAIVFAIVIPLVLLAIWLL